MRTNDSIRELVENFKIGGTYRGIASYDEPIAPRTTFQIGGSAPFFFQPEDCGSLVSLLRFLSSEGIPQFILGGGSNIVVSDGGFDGAVISTAGIDYVRLAAGKSCGEEDAEDSDCALVECGAGASVAALVEFCTENEFSGAQQFAGLPGSVGGALYMNARCFGRSMSDLFVCADYAELPAWDIRKMFFSPESWDYKKSPFQENSRVVLSAVLRLRKAPGAKDEIAAACGRFVEERRARGHFRYPSAGSAFKNDRNFGMPSGKIIDSEGLCGVRIGGAQIAPWHGNLIVNTGGATQRDVKSLVDFAVRTVRERRGLELQPEIIFCGKAES